MILATVSAQTPIPRLFSTIYPFVWGIDLTYDSTGIYWSAIFGAPIETQSSTVVMLGLTVNDNIYTETLNITDCQATQASWFFDFATQQLWVHLDHDTEGMTARVAYGKALGFSDDAVVSISGVEYLPFIDSIPSLAQVQDLVDYEKLATINGAMVLRAAGGLLDYLTDENLIGGDATIAYLPDDVIDDAGEADSSDMIPLAAFFVQDYRSGFEEFHIQLQDRRIAQDASFPQTRFAVADYPNLDDSSIDVPIPVVYGYQRELKAYPTNGKAASTTVTFRAALLLTALTTVYLKIADKWTTSTPSNVNLATGTFDVAGAKSSTTAAPYECRIEATGIAVTYASDIIKDLNSRYGAVTFLDSFYDTAEWTLEQASLLTAGIVFNEVTTIFEAARKVQAGANVGFRYEVNALGQRTIRIDDNSRDAGLGVDNVEILAPERILPETDTEFLAAQVRIGYQHSDESGKYLTVLNSTYAAGVLTNYRSRREVRFDTLLTNSTHAAARAALDAAKFSSPLVTFDAVLRGARYLKLRILDILPIAITADPIDLDTGELYDQNDREFYGVQRCKVIGIDPDYRRIQNAVRFQILGPITPYSPEGLIYAFDEERILFADGEQIMTAGGN